jgi:cytochrome c oxidase subunit 3
MAEAVYRGQALPVGARGRNSVGWWGMVCLIATEASLFAYLLFSYYYVAVQRGPAWAPDAHPTMKLAADASWAAWGSASCWGSRSSSCKSSSGKPRPIA